ncbi:hypothetical protein HY792_06470 [Candidatus Desantisbacteria bacterium]|nr:hypothetical protein [Candidatus Desantisbacteria bacterium]
MRYFRSLIFCGLLSIVVSPVWGGMVDSCDGKIGALIIDNKMYYEINIQPEFVFGQLKMGIDLPLRWNDEDGIRKEDWDGKEDIATVFRYVQWAEKKAEPLYLRVGNIDSATLGNGFIVGDYANISREDTKNEKNTLTPHKRTLGSVIDFNLNSGGIETLVNDIISPRLYGARCFVKPLTAMPVMQGTEVGFSYVNDTKAGTNTEVKKNLTVYGMDFFIFVFKEYVTLYGDYADIKNAGNGMGYGIKGGFGSLESFRTDWGLGCREDDDNFIYGLFNSSYEVNKPMPGATTTTQNKVACGNISFNIRKAIALGFYYEDAKNSNPSLTSQLTVDKNVFHAITKQAIGVNAFYDQKDIKESKKNTTLTTQISYGLSANIDMVYSVKKYSDDEGKVFKTSSIATAVKF